MAHNFRRQTNLNRLRLRRLGVQHQMTMKLKAALRRFSPLLPLVLAALVVVSSGCGTTTRVNNVTNESVGKQLLDLEQAYKNGIITEDQYNDLKKNIIRKND